LYSIFFDGIDNGISVPVVLVMLKDFLISSDGIPAEGIFRKSGLESEMTILKEKINAGEPFESSNSHTIATLMKVSFSSLSKFLNNLN
jgi:hypothetical protein